MYSIQMDAARKERINKQYLRQVLSIAGSDTSGGAGVQADLKAMSACGVFGMSVITALTAQNTKGVHAIYPIPADFVGTQIDAIFTDIRVDAVKIGMLGNADVMKVTGERLRRYHPDLVVVDPVLLSKHGYPLMDDTAREVFLSEIVPLAYLITPNLPETTFLAGFIPKTIDELERAGKKILSLGAKAVLIKGGHRESDADDVLVTTQGVYIFKGERLASQHTHGTGCTLSSAIAAYLARGLTIVKAIEYAKNYVRVGIEHGLNIGHGIGPIHHFYNLYQGEVPQL
ncbi:bifunctional hydroxymethylpyrimidine kinase/phosphomethylpyrimidine kinase [Gracilinema caldarium]|uniref:hydroxymethylpyrimidine kinase n=1 Tax=Gracilinema caldarium (strain ATCC 51460 / DSM 7334 / H1) TaxID=744872 RepID=F8EWV2_GRAC1|nr:bifunctional hydroxymethylpyrimidine kinase/phosphomethylpyrimidine kinase [Gracilinema caldarium]AEJ18338.1 phosphomethylpyrimidine kinase [Gracilinema caldarium DSM 7334]